MIEGCRQCGEPATVVGMDRETAWCAECIEAARVWGGAPTELVEWDETWERIGTRAYWFDLDAASARLLEEAPAD